MEFIKKEINGKNIKIPTDIINNYINVLGITEQEAMQIYLEDEGYIINEEQERLTQKAKENKVTASLNAKSGKPRKKTERTRKADTIKENLITDIADFLKSKNIDNVQITNVSKIIEFDIDEVHYKIDLIRQKSKK